MAKANKKATASVSDAVATTVSDYFAQVGSRNEVFSTSDGNVFENLGFAKNHAATLDNKDIVPHTNAKNIEVVDEEELDGESGSGAAATQVDK